MPSPSPTPTVVPTVVINDNKIPLGTSKPEREPRANPTYFSDIDTKYWAAEYIINLKELGIVDGYAIEDGTFVFRPDNDITRAEMVKLIVASLNLEIINDYEGSRFADWDKVADWAKPYMAAAIEAGIVLGSAEAGGLYINADDNIIREQMIAMAIRSLEVDTLEEAVVGTPDASAVSEWAVSEVAFAVENKMINLHDGNVNPIIDATRAEAAMILYMLLDYRQTS